MYGEVLIEFVAVRLRSKTYCGPKTLVTKTRGKTLANSKRGCVNGSRAIRIKHSLTVELEENLANRICQIQLKRCDLRSPTWSTEETMLQKSRHSVTRTHGQVRPGQGTEICNFGVISFVDVLQHLWAEKIVQNSVTSVALMVAWPQKHHEEKGPEITERWPNPEIFSNRSRQFGVGRRGSPRFVPISPFSSDLFRFALLVFGNTPICSDLFRFLPICSDLFSEQIRTNRKKPLSADPFCKSPI